MPPFFSFSPFDTAASIKMAISYVPHILKNHIKVRPYNGFLYVLNGAYTYTYEGGSFTARAGDLVYLPARSIPYDYCIRPTDEALEQTMQIEFELKKVSEDLSVSFGTHPTLLRLSNSSTVKYAMRAAISAHAKGTDAAKILAVSELFRIISVCVEESSKNKSTTAANAIAPAVAYLEAHCTERVSTAVLASLCQISESQLRRSFRVATGMSPVSYKRYLLHLRARDLLRTGEFKIGEISEMLGFYDIYAFSHFFTQAEGISPREFCRLARTSIEN